MEQVGGLKLTNSNHEQLARANHVENALGVFENLNHHLLFVSRRWFVLGMRTRMHNAVHIELEVVELLTIRVGLRRINRDNRAIFQDERLFFDDGRYDLWVFGGEPPESSRNTHGERCATVSVSMQP